jgi:hypothetical protein
MPGSLSPIPADNSEILQEYLAADPTNKVIVFSQFTTYIDLVNRYLGQCNVPSLKYVGSMNPGDREDTIGRFNATVDKGEPRVMLISLMCGGVGLNLTCASRVISLDMAWNAATGKSSFLTSPRLLHPFHTIAFPLSNSYTVRNNTSTLYLNASEAGACF